MTTLTEKLHFAEAGRDRVLSEREADIQSFKEEMEKLLCKVMRLSEEKGQLQEALDGLKQEKQKLTAELEERTKMVHVCKADLIKSVSPIADLSYPGKKAYPK